MQKSKRGKKRSRREKKPSARSVLDKMSKVKHESDKKQKDLTPLGSEFPVPSPVEGSWTKRLRTLVQNAGVDSGSVQHDESEDENQSSEDKSNESVSKKELISNEALFKKLKSSISARSSLSAVHAARAHKYGHVQFGPKTWYKDSENISEKLTSQDDRKKFRQGLKSDVDFLNQLNLHDLVKYFIGGKQNISTLNKSTRKKLGDIFECLKDVPLIDILKLIDPAKAGKIFTSIDKIVALAHFSQSMGNYYARDDSLDPALNVVCEALRGNFDIEYILRKRGGTFQSLASTYYHLRSSGDRDLSGPTHFSRNRGSRGTGGYRSYTRKTPPSSKTCWEFDKNDRCSKRDCKFSHRCKRCGSKKHGERSFRKKSGSN